MLTQLKGVGENLKKKLNTLGIYTVNDLLLFLPSSYINLDAEYCGDTADGSFCKASEIVTKKYNISKGGMKIFRISCGEGKRSFSAVWFNMPYISRNIEVGEEYTFFGKIKKNGKSFEYINPQFEKKSEKSKFTGICPVYRLKGLIPQGTFRSVMDKALELRDKFPKVISVEEEREFSLIPLSDAFYCIHRPESFDYSQAVFRINLENAVRRLAAFNLEKVSIPRERKFSYLGNWDNTLLAVKNLPYRLMNGQYSVLETLKDKFLSNDFFNAIICGDVGSGKTIVALLLSHFVAESGKQTAFMAPTEILAKQHYETAVKFFSGTVLKPILLTAGLNAKERQAAAERIKRGESNLVIGTHSLLNDKLEFNFLSFVVIDEQHRFGVEQRTKLIKKGDADILTLSATPIPRSLQLILFGDIDYFTLEKRFSGNIITKIVGDDKLDAMLEYIVTVCNQGEKAFIVLPKIEDEEGCEMQSAEGIYKTLSKKYPDLPKGLLHGKMKEAEKTTVMNKFSSGEIKLLVSTTVVEVGIDVPDSSIMAVLNAERMGLAALHQLRGRVGRGGQRAYCFLHTEDPENARLKKIADCDDGFTLAEFDYSLRGGGNVFGKNQAGKEGLSGLTPELIKVAKEIASTIDLQKTENILKEELFRFDLAEISLT